MLEFPQRVAIHVPGIPVAKGRPRFARRGKFVQAYTPKKTVTYENAVSVAAAKVMGSFPPLRGPLGVEVFVWLPVPASWSAKKKRAAIYPTTKPDADNYGKAALDALNGIVFEDDSQVVNLTIHKRYGTACMTIQVQPIVSEVPT